MKASEEVQHPDRAADSAHADSGAAQVKIAQERLAIENRAPRPIESGAIPRFDITYSLERELVERAAVAAAQDGATRDSHRELADRYADRAWAARERRCEEGNPC